MKSLLAYATTMWLCSLLFIRTSYAQGSDSTIDPPFMGQRTTCDQCTIYNYNFWCPVDYSCYTPNASDIADPTPETQSDIFTQCNTYCAGVYKLNNPTASDSTAFAAGKCVDMQECFFSADQCSDCALSSGHWCIANRKCYAFESRYQLPNIMNKSSAPSEYICLEDCPDKSCVKEEPYCPSCEQLRPPLTCGALLPAFILASTGAGFFVTLIAWFFWSYIQRRRAAARQQELINQRREQRLAAKRAGRAATRAGQQKSGTGSNSGGQSMAAMGDLRLEPTQINYDDPYAD